MRVWYSKTKRKVRQRYCGPAAVSALCGVTIERAAVEINRQAGRRPGLLVKKTRPSDICHIIEGFGFDVLPRGLTRHGITVAAMLDHFARPWERTEKHLVWTTTHFFALEGDMAYDSLCHVGWNINKPGARLRRSKVKGLRLIKKNYRNNPVVAHAVEEAVVATRGTKEAVICVGNGNKVHIVRVEDQCRD